MSEQIIPRRELEFLLYDFLNVEALCERHRFADHDRESFDAALATGRAVATDHFLPHYALADAKEPIFDGDKVTLPGEVAKAVDAFAEAGLMAAGHDYELDGMQLPVTVLQALMSQFHSANVSTAAYPFLTMAAANMLLAHGSQEQIGLYLKPMLSGRFFGTMCLSEPQAGSSLGDITTRAIPQADGSYFLKGTKMWISGGDQEISENIVHMVLARMEGAEAGVKGISLFIVPKYLVNADGSLGPRNGVRLAGLNHKMGYRGTVNTVLNFGESEDCVGYLMGEAGQGLGIMFHMMNEARIGVGLGAAALGYAGYAHSLRYAMERPQGRAHGKGGPQTPIIAHPDVKRMLMAQKAYAEGGLALCLYAARLVDEQQTATDATARKEAGQLLDLLTPVVKAWPSEWCLEANKWAIQILGGYGYTRDFPVEQIYRDNRLNMIHEGTNGIQSLDLLGRKAGQEGGAGLQLLSSRIRQSIQEAHKDDMTAEFAESLSMALSRVTSTTRVLLKTMLEGGSGLALSNSHVYLDMMGRLVVGWIWLQQGLIAHQKILHTKDRDEQAYLSGKIHTCRWYFRFELPQVEAQAALLSSLDDTHITMHEDWF